MTQKNNLIIGELLMYENDSSTNEKIKNILEEKTQK